MVVGHYDPRRVGHTLVLGLPSALSPPDPGRDVQVEGSVAPRYERFGTGDSYDRYGCASTSPSCTSVTRNRTQSGRQTRGPSGSTRRRPAPSGEGKMSRLGG